MQVPPLGHATPPPDSLAPVLPIQPSLENRPQATEDEEFEDPRDSGPQLAVITGPPTVGDIMTAPVYTARSDQSIREVVGMLGRHQVSGFPVVDGEGRLAGVISQSDLAAHVSREWSQIPARDPAGFFQSLWIADPDLHERMAAETPVSELMAPNICFATPDASLDEAADLLLKHGIHRLVVLQEGRIVGIVSSLDLLRAYRRL